MPPGSSIAWYQRALSTRAGRSTAAAVVLKLVLSDRLPSQCPAVLWSARAGHHAPGCAGHRRIGRRGSATATAGNARASCSFRGPLFRRNTVVVSVPYHIDDHQQLEVPDLMEASRRAGSVRGIAGARGEEIGDVVRVRDGGRVVERPFDQVRRSRSPCSCSTGGQPCVGLTTSVVGRVAQPTRSHPMDRSRPDDIGRRSRGQTS